GLRCSLLLCDFIFLPCHRSVLGVWVTIPCLAVEEAAADFLRPPRQAFKPPCFILKLYDSCRTFTLRFRAPMPPLLEVERYTVLCALIPQGSNPVGMCRAPGATPLATRNNPADLLLF